MDPKAAGSDAKDPCPCPLPPAPHVGTLSQGQKWSLGLSPDTCPGILGAQPSVRQWGLGASSALPPAPSGLSALG